MADSNLSTLVVAEHDNQTVSVDTLRTLQAATHLQAEGSMLEVSVLVIGYQCQPVVDLLSKLTCVSKVLVADSQTYQHALAENYSELIANVGRDFSHILASATTFGKNIMPRVSALLDVGQLSDVTSIEGVDEVIRPVYAGNAMARVKSNDAIKVITVRSSAFDAVEASEGEPCSIQSLDTDIPSTSSTFIEQQKVESERPELPAARVVISGGRGLGSKENFAMIEQLADKLDGAIGASRAAVDAGYVSNDLQVGQTGKIVAPELYIAVGISGAIQHLAGMKDSKVIVAINSDPEAPIFQIADYGLVGDLFDLMPELIRSV